MKKWNCVEPLSEAHDLTEFSCGNDAIDGWLHSTARRADAGGSTRVTVCLHPELGVVGFFALSSHQVESADIRKKDAGGITNAIPATLLARMGLHHELQGDGLGADLIAEALKVAVESARGVASRLVVVDAKNERLVQFYEDHSFIPAVNTPLRLYMKMATAIEVVAVYDS